MDNDITLNGGEGFVAGPMRVRPPGGIDRVTLNQILMTRAQMAGVLGDRRRNVYRECGYPDPNAITPHFLKELFDREPVANRVVTMLPSECWMTAPDVTEDEDAKRDTPFEAAVKTLGKTLSGEQSFYDDNSGNALWESAFRMDVVSRIGHYGVWVIGTDDGLDLSLPAAGVEVEGEVPGEKGSAPAPKQKYSISLNAEVKAKAGKAGGRQLIYLQCFPETSALVTRWETNRASPRYGRPVMYQVTFNDPFDTYGYLGAPGSTQSVHWTRVIHVTDGRLSNDVVGTPAIRPVLHPILDVQKVRGAAAEMYWLAALQGLAFETHPQLGGEVDIDWTALRGTMENYRNTLERILIGEGGAFKSLGPQVSPPNTQIDVLLDSICLQIGCPKRIFVGSERGELASSQDDSTWNDRLRARQNGYLSPRLIAPLLNRLVLLGVLPEPESYKIVWPDLNALSPAEKADVTTKRAQAWGIYSDKLASIMTQKDFATRIDSMTEDEAQAVVDNVADQVDSGENEAGGSPLLGLVGGVTGIIQLFTLAQQHGISEEQLKQLMMLFYGVSEEKATEIIADGIPEQPDPFAQAGLNPDGTPMSPAVDPNNLIEPPAGEGDNAPA